jgi:3-oxoacyl-[acyl-carrier protein] reductase
MTDDVERSGDGERPTAIVTGSSRGIGKAIAFHLAREGYAVVLNYASDDAQAAAAYEACRAITPHAHLVKADVTDREAVERLVRTTVERCGRVDLLVNNAGLNVDKPFLELTDRDWDVVLQVNLRAVFVCSQVAVREMLTRGGGVIINVAATTGIRGRTNGANYCAAKAGVLALTKCLALELAPHIRVNCVLPGSTHARDIEDPIRVKSRSATIPLQRLGQPAEIAHAVAFLASTRASYITGQKLIVDGGQYMD